MRPEPVRAPVQHRQGRLPPRAGAGRQLTVEEGQRVRRRQPGHRGRQAQVAGRHGGTAARTPLRQHARPLWVPLSPVQRQTTRASGPAREDERAHHPGGLDHPRVEMGNPRGDPGRRRAGVRGVDRETVPRRHHDEGQRRLASHRASGRGLGRARRTVRRGPADQLPGSRVPPLPDRRRRKPAGRDVPRLRAAAVEHVDQAHPGGGEHCRDRRPHPPGASDLDPRRPPGRQSTQTAPGRGMDDGERRRVGALPVHGLGPPS